MQEALLWGDAATPEREKAPRRQPESPTHFSTSRPGYSTSPAADQELRPARGKDGSTVIRNSGHLSRVIGDTVKLLKLRYGRKGCPAEHSADVYRVVAALEAAAAEADPKFVPDLHAWSDRHLRRLSEAERAAIRADLRAHPVEVRLEHLERVVLAHQAALQEQADLALASTMLVTVTLAMLEGNARETARQYVLAALADEPAHAGARALIVKLTADPKAAFLAEHGARGTVVLGPDTPQ